jgi:magnesium and cobalt transporter
VADRGQPPDPSPGRWPFWGRRRAPDRPAHPALGASAQEREIAEGLDDLRTLDVRQVMTPRVDVVALTIPVTPDDVIRVVRETGHRAYPVIHNDLDDVVGVLFVKDFFRTGRRPTAEELAGARPVDIARRLRTPFIVAETSGVLEALAELRRNRKSFAVVVDEYGGVAGVVNIRDLVEPLVGELHDEFDEDEEPDIVRVDARRWLIDGQTSVEEVRERLNLDLPAGEYVTLGGFLFDGFGHIPEEGERLSVGGWDLKVVEMDKRRVARVVAKRDEAPVGPEDPGRGAAAGAGRSPSPSGGPGPTR